MGQGIKKPLVHAPGAASPFFVGSMVGFTSYWFEQGANVGGMWLGYTAPGASVMQRGVHFADLATASERISIVAHPALSPQCKANVERSLRIRIPPKDLILTPTGMAAHSTKCDGLEEVKRFMEDRGRVIPPSGSMAAPFYVRNHQLTPDTVRAMKTEIQGCGSIVGLSYELEPVTDWMSIYRTNVYVTL